MQDSYMLLVNLNFKTTFSKVIAAEDPMLLGTSKILFHVVVAAEDALFVAPLGTRKILFHEVVTSVDIMFAALLGTCKPFSTKWLPLRMLCLQSHSA